jgi:hypothetical protein
MIGSLVALVAGGTLLGISVKRQFFMRVMGPVLSAQYKVQRWLPNVVEYSEKAHFNTARLIAIALGVLLVALGLVSLIVSAP